MNSRIVKTAIIIIVLAAVAAIIYSKTTSQPQNPTAVSDNQTQAISSSEQKLVVSLKSGQPTMITFHSDK